MNYNIYLWQYNILFPKGLKKRFQLAENNMAVNTAAIQAQATKYNSPPLLHFFSYCFHICF